MCIDSTSVVPKFSNDFLTVPKISRGDGGGRNSSGVGKRQLTSNPIGNSGCKSRTSRVKILRQFKVKHWIAAARIDNQPMVEK